VAVHQSGKACLLASYDAERLEKYGIVPNCAEHRHARRAVAEEMCFDRLVRRIKLPGRDRFAWTSDRNWRAVRGVMQLVSGPRPGAKHHPHYPIPAIGARSRGQIVALINAERTAPLANQL
jgi:hypothetical protein